MEEIRWKRTYDLDDPSSGALEFPPQYKLGHEWVPRFIDRHPHLKVVIGRRIDSVRVDGTSKSVLEAWFNAYRHVIQEYKIEEKNIYNMDGRNRVFNWNNGVDTSNH